MTSIREQILVKVQAILDGPGKPPGLTVHRERTRPLELDSLPAVLIYAEDDEPNLIGGRQGPIIERALTVRVECRAKGTESTPVDAALDPILVWAIKTIMGNERMDALANGVREGVTRWMSEEGQETIAAAAIQFHITYRTSRTNPETNT